MDTSLLEVCIQWIVGHGPQVSFRCYLHRILERSLFSSYVESTL